MTSCVVTLVMFFWGYCYMMPALAQPGVCKPAKFQGRIGTWTATYRLQTWMKGRKRHMSRHVCVETEPEKLVKEENVPEDRLPSKKEVAAMRRGTC